MVGWRLGKTVRGAGASGLGKEGRTEGGEVGLREWGGGAGAGEWMEEERAKRRASIFKLVFGL